MAGTVALTVASWVASVKSRPARRHIYYDIVFTTVIQRLSAFIVVTLLALCAAPFLMPAAAPPIDPLDRYAEALPGQSKRAVMDAGFSCAFGDYCTQASSSGPFQYLEVITRQGTVSRLTISLREGTLLLGDLVLWWGKPCRRVYGSIVDLWWPHLNITATGHPSPTASRYFSTIRRISISRQAVSDLDEPNHSEGCEARASTVAPEPPN